MIKGLNITLAEGGKIKIGGLGKEMTSKKGEPYRLPVKYDHFLITKTTRNKKDDFELDTGMMDALDKDEDGCIRAIPIILHSDDIDLVFPTSYAIYAGHKLQCRGDGQDAVEWVMAEGKRTGETRQKPCPCPLLDAKSGPTCKPHGTLHCSIVAPGHATAGSVHKWRTTSIISVQQMVGSLQQILSVVGTLRGLPLWLVLKPMKVNPTGDVETTVFVCHVELRAKDIASVQKQALEQAVMRRQVGTGQFDAAYKALVSAPAADDEPPEEASRVQQEFHPEVVDTEPEPPPSERIWTLTGGQKVTGTINGKTCAACDVKTKTGDALVYYEGTDELIHATHIWRPT